MKHTLKKHKHDQKYTENDKITNINNNKSHMILNNKTNRNNTIIEHDITSFKIISDRSIQNQQRINIQNQNQIMSETTIKTKLTTIHII